jgi:hypothetical protein
MKGGKRKENMGKERKRYETNGRENTTEIRVTEEQKWKEEKGKKTWERKGKYMRQTGEKIRLK